MFSAHWGIDSWSEANSVTTNPTGVFLIISKASGNARGRMTGARSGSARKTMMMTYEKTMAIRFFFGVFLPVKAQRNTLSKMIMLVSNRGLSMPVATMGGRVF